MRTALLLSLLAGASGLNDGLTGGVKVNQSATTGGGAKQHSQHGGNKCPSTYKTCADSGRCDSLNLIKSPTMTEDNILPFSKTPDYKRRHKNIRSKHLRIRMIQSWADGADFFAYPTYVLNQLHFAEKFELIGDKKPFVYMPEDSTWFSGCMSGSNEKNFWTEFFEPVANVIHGHDGIKESDVWEFSQDTIANMHFNREAIRTQPYLLGEKTVTGDAGTSNWVSCQRSKAQALVDKYLTVKPSVFKATEKRLLGQGKNQKFVGGHLSGESKWLSSSETKESYHKLLSTYLARKEFTAMIHSNDERFFNRIEGQFGVKRVIGESSYSTPLKATPAQKKAASMEFLVTAMMFAQTDVLIKSWSAPAEFAVYFHNKYFKDQDQKVVDLQLVADPFADDTSNCYAGHRCSDKPLNLKSFAALKQELKSGSCSRQCAATRVRRAGKIPDPALMGEKTAVLVVAHWKEDLDWLDEQPFCYVIMEKRGNGEDVGKDPTFIAPNKGNEASSFLKFISDTYKFTPDHIMMVHGARRSEHAIDLVSILQNIRLDSYPYASLNGIYFPFQEKEDFCDIYSFWSSDVSPHIKSLPPRSQYDVSMACCAQFLVSKERIHNNPLELYEDLYKFASSSKDLGHGQAQFLSKPSVEEEETSALKTSLVFEGAYKGCDTQTAKMTSFDRGEIIELTWHRILGEDWHATIPDPLKLCGSEEICPVNLPVLKKTPESQIGVVSYGKKGGFWSQGGLFLEAVTTLGHTKSLKQPGSLGFVTTPTFNMADLEHVADLVKAKAVYNTGNMAQTLGREIVPESNMIKAAEPFVDRLVSQNLLRGDDLKVLLWDDSSCGVDFYGLRVEPWLLFDGCSHAPSLRLYSSAHRKYAKDMDIIISANGEGPKLTKAHPNQVLATCSMDRTGALASNDTIRLALHKNAEVPVNLYSHFYLGDSVKTELRSPKPMVWEEKIPRVALAESHGCNKKENKASYRDGWVQSFSASSVNQLVDSFESCYNNAVPQTVWAQWEGKPVKENAGMGEHLTRMANLRPYMFTLCHEESENTLVITERVYQALAVGSVPIYRGPHPVEDLVPCKNCVIDAKDFETPEALVQHVERLINDADAYESMLAWKNNKYNAEEFPKFELEVRKRSVDSAVCRLADRAMVERGEARQNGGTDSCEGVCLEKVRSWQHYAP